MQQTNGTANGHEAPLTQWKFGLINFEGKYFTAESFGFKINVTGTALKKKQTWTFEQDTKKDEVVYIKSHMGRYLATDQKGNLTCESEERGELEQFVVEYDSSGRWGIRHSTYGFYLGGTDENIKCFGKNMGKEELWIAQLASHPQVILRNVQRRRCAVLCEDEIHVKETIPWGQEGLIILHFVDGKYALKTCDNRFLHKDGKLVDELDPNDTMFTLEIKSGANCGLAFKSISGHYLTAVGATHTMKGRNKKVTADELFTLENCHPQVNLTSQNGKFVSVKQGVDVSANQSEVCDKSTFQMEYDKATEKWAFRTIVENKYWSLESFSGIQAAASSISNKTLFKVDFQGNGTVTIKAPNDNYLYNKATGSMLANVPGEPDNRFFTIKMINRPFLILKSEFGFVGLKTLPTSKSDTKPELVCNKVTYGITFLEPQDDGYYHLRALNRKYWSLGGDNCIVAESDMPKDKFLLEFKTGSVMTIKAPNGKFMKGDQYSFRAVGEEEDAGILWEF